MDFYAARRRLGAPVNTGGGPVPKGWRREGVYPVVVGPVAPGVDRWDSCPSRLPYPVGMPDPGLVVTDPMNVDVHARALRGWDRQVHEGSVRAAGGERVPGLGAAILRRLAVRQELGTGFVALSDVEAAFLAVDGDGETGFVS